MNQQSTNTNFSSHLNWLRFFCIVCIFLLHTGISYSYIPDLFPFWHIKSHYVSVIITGFCAFANSACMPLFFLFSGMGGRLKIQSGDKFYYNRRSKKWLNYLLWIWPLIGISIWAALNYLSPTEIHFGDILFPDPALPESANKTGFALPFNLFHLWYLFVLLFIEVLMKFIYPLIIKKFNGWFLLLLPCLQTLVILIQNQGYMTPPIILDSLNLGSIFVYGGWYSAGFIIPSLLRLHVNTPKIFKPENSASKILMDQNLKPKILVSKILNQNTGIRLFYTTTLLGFFLFKYVLISQDFNQLNIGSKLGIALFDSLLPWAVLGVWYDLMNQKHFHRLIARFRIVERFRNTVIKYALEIYVLQIPIIFGILSIWGRFVRNNIFFEIQAVSKSTESGKAFFDWMILTILTAITLAVIIELKHLIQSVFKHKLHPTSSNTL